MLSSQRRRRIQNHATAQNFVFFLRDGLLRHLPTSSYYYSHEATTSTLGGCPMEGQTAASYAIRSKYAKTILAHEDRLAEIFFAKKNQKSKLREEEKTSEQENETP